MSGEEELPPELKSLEAALASLVPHAGRLDRDRLLFEAGRASADQVSAEQRPRVTRLAWPAAFAAMATVAAVLAVMVAVRPGPQVVDRIVYVPAKAPAAPPPRAADQRDREELRREVPPAGAPEPRGMLAPFLAERSGQSDWFSLRRDAVDLRSLDRLLAAREPLPDGNVPARPDRAPDSYRALLDSLLGPRQNGG